MGEVLRVQAGLSQHIGNSHLYWRAVEGLSVILKQQRPHPQLADGLEAEAEAEASPRERERPETESSTQSFETDKEEEAFPRYPPTPAGSEREAGPVLDRISWKQLARISVVNGHFCQKQIMPSYLGGKHAKLGLDQLKAQVHANYPLKVSSPNP